MVRLLSDSEEMKHGCHMVQGGYIVPMKLRHAGTERQQSDKAIEWRIRIRCWRRHSRSVDEKAHAYLLMSLVACARRLFASTLSCLTIIISQTRFSQRIRVSTRLDPQVETLANPAPAKTNPHLREVGVGARRVGVQRKSALSNDRPVIGVERPTSNVCIQSQRYGQQRRLWLRRCEHEIIVHRSHVRAPAFSNHHASASILESRVSQMPRGPDLSPQTTYPVLVQQDSHTNASLSPQNTFVPTINPYQITDQFGVPDDNLGILGGDWSLE